eukprot:UN33825
MNTQNSIVSIYETLFEKKQEALSLKQFIQNEVASYIEIPKLLKLLHKDISVIVDHIINWDEDDTYFQICNEPWLDKLGVVKNELNKVIAHQKKEEESLFLKLFGELRQALYSLDFRMGKTNWRKYLPEYKKYITLHKLQEQIPDTAEYQNLFINPLTKRYDLDDLRDILERVKHIDELKRLNELAMEEKKKLRKMMTTLVGEFLVYTSKTLRRRIGIAMFKKIYNTEHHVPYIDMNFNDCNAKSIREFFTNKFNTTKEANEFMSLMKKLQCLETKDKMLLGSKSKILAKWNAIRANRRTSAPVPALNRSRHANNNSNRRIGRSKTHKRRKSLQLDKSVTASLTNNYQAEYTVKKILAYVRSQLTVSKDFEWYARHFPTSGDVPKVDCKFDTLTSKFLVDMFDTLTEGESAEKNEKITNKFFLELQNYGAIKFTDEVR